MVVLEDTTGHGYRQTRACSGYDESPGSTEATTVGNHERTVALPAPAVALGVTSKNDLFYVGCRGIYGTNRGPHRQDFVHMPP